ncbi:hypothetical protein CON84_23485 [Bacillus sp. AFS094228]|nr:hypothetical protein CON84_23485 [Bacillus sp. AFS094228]
MGKVFEYFKDFAVVTSLLTVLSYFLSYSFDKGISDFYGIGDISFAEIGLPSIINTLQALSPLVLVFGLLLLFANFLFIIIRPIFRWITMLFMKVVYYFPLIGLGSINWLYKFFSKEVPKNELQGGKLDKFKDKFRKKGEFAVKEWKKAKEDIFNIEIEEETINKISLIYTYSISTTIYLLYIPKLTLDISPKEFPELWLVSASILVIIPLFVTGGLVIFQKVRSTQLGAVSNPSQDPVQQQDQKDGQQHEQEGNIGENTSTSISFKILNIWLKSKWLIKVIIIFLIIVIASKMFYQYGYTTAEEKKDYMTVEHNGATLVILEKGKDLLITAEVKKGDANPKLNGEYKLIELKPNNENKELTLMNETFPNGIQVEDNKRKKFLEKLNSLFK